MAMNMIFDIISSKHNNLSFSFQIIITETAPLYPTIQTMNFTEGKRITIYNRELTLELWTVKILHIWYKVMTMKSMMRFTVVVELIPTCLAPAFYSQQGKSNKNTLLQSYIVQYLLIANLSTLPFSLTNAWEYLKTLQNGWFYFNWKIVGRWRKIGRFSLCHTKREIIINAPIFFLLKNKCM